MHQSTIQCDVAFTPSRITASSSRSVPLAPLPSFMFSLLDQLLSTSTHLLRQCHRQSPPETQGPKRTTEEHHAPKRFKRLRFVQSRSRTRHFVGNEPCGPKRKHGACCTVNTHRDESVESKPPDSGPLIVLASFVPLPPAPPLSRTGQNDNRARL